MALFNSKENWPLHGMNMAKRVVVGARWLGREQKYADYFDGYLAGLSVNFGEHINEKVSVLLDNMGQLNKPRARLGYSTYNVVYCFHARVV